MSLVKCPECSTDISSHALACTRCGYPMGSAFSEPVDETVAQEAAAIQEVLVEDVGAMEHESRKARLWCVLGILAGLGVIGGGVWLMIYTRTAVLDLSFVENIVGRHLDIKYLGEVGSIGLWGLALATFLHGVLWLRRFNRLQPVLSSLRNISAKLQK